MNNSIPHWNPVSLALLLTLATSPRPTLAAAEPKQHSRSETAPATARQTASQPWGRPYVYKQVGDRPLQLFVTLPPASENARPRPAIVFFHGGGWVGGQPTQFNEHSAYFASRGLVAVQVEYRLLDKAATAPPLICVQDAQSALRWVRGHATDLGIDPQRIAAAGGSAGGHLAAFVGLVGGLDDPQDDLKISPKANALVLFNPVLYSWSRWAGCTARPRWPGPGEV